MTETTLAPRIRRAQMDDAEPLATLSTQLGYPSSAAELSARLRAILPDPAHVVFVAEVPGAGPRGFAHLHVGVALQSGERVELLGLVTDAALRSRGLGALLVAEAERWTRDKGFQTLCVRCNVVRPDAHRFYERLGFECSKTQKHFRKSLAAMAASELA